MRVNLEPSVWTDARFTILARLMRWEHADTAIARSARVWRQCVIEGAHTLPPATVDALLGEGGAEAFVAAGLGENVSGMVRVRGTHGRIEWHEKLKENGKKGGRPKAEPTAKPNGLPTAKPNGLENRNPLALALAPDPAHTEREHAPAEAVAATRPRGRAVGTATPLPATWQPTEEHRAYAYEHDLSLDREAESFRDHADANGRRQVSWDAAFRTWLRKARDYRERDRAKNGDPRKWVVL
jgi:hypothetical protein